jgi:hypothetical protein
MTRVLAGLVVNDAVVAVAGYALLCAVRLAGPRLRDLRLLGLAFVLGWAVLGTVLSLLVLAGLGPGIAAVTTTAVVIVAVCAAARLRGLVPPPAPPPAKARVPLLALAPAAFGAVVLVALSAAALAVAAKGRHYVGYWDALEFWIPKAETIFYGHGIDPGVWGSISHPEYPPLVPAMDAATFSFAGGFHPAILSVQAALLGIAFLGAVLVLVDRFAPAWISLPTLALLAAAPWFWWRLQTPLADQPLAYLVACAAVVCVIWLYERGRAWLVLGAVFIAGATLTKLEGSFMSVVLIVVVLAAGVAVHRRRALPAVALLAAPLVVLPWRLWLSRHGLPTTSPDYHVTDLLRPGYLADRTWRLRGALSVADHVPFGERRTAALVWIAAAALVVAAVRRPLIVAAVGAWLALASFGLLCIYWIGTLDLDFYLASSIGRVGTTVIIVGAVVAPLLLGLALQPRGRPAYTAE